MIPVGKTGKGQILLSGLIPYKLGSTSAIPASCVDFNALDSKSVSVWCVVGRTVYGLGSKSVSVWCVVGRTIYMG